MTALAAIREATRRSHEELEAGSDLVARLISPVGRRATLTAFHRLYAPAEAALAPLLAPLPDLEFDRRRKAGVLLADLEALGAVASGPPARPPPFRSVAHALGFAYVLEGSTLGGRVVRKRVALAGASPLGLAFFDVYGPATGRRWKRFCEVLNRECADATPQAVDGALAGFAYIGQGLMDPALTARTAAA